MKFLLVLLVLCLLYVNIESRSNLMPVPTTNPTMNSNYDFNDEILKDWNSYKVKVLLIFINFINFIVNLITNFLTFIKLG